MSSTTVDPYCPLGQASQAVAFENGFNVGFALFQAVKVTIETFAKHGDWSIESAETIRGYNEASPAQHVKALRPAMMKTFGF